MPRPIYRTGGAVGGSAIQSNLADSIDIPEGVWQILLVATSTRQVTAVSSITIDGEALTLEDFHNNRNDNSRIELWYKLLPPRGSGLTLQANWGSGVYPALVWAVFDAVYIDDPFRYTEKTWQHQLSGVSYDFTMANGNVGDSAIDFISYFFSTSSTKVDQL